VSDIILWIVHTTIYIGEVISWRTNKKTIWLHLFKCVYYSQTIQVHPTLTKNGKESERDFESNHLDQKIRNTKISRPL